jgi:hypothetical protein
MAGLKRRSYGRKASASVVDASQVLQFSAAVAPRVKARRTGAALRVASFPAAASACAARPTGVPDDGSPEAPLSAGSGPGSVSPPQPRYGDHPRSHDAVSMTGVVPFALPIIDSYDDASNLISLRGYGVGAPTVSALAGSAFGNLDAELDFDLDIDFDIGLGSDSARSSRIDTGMHIGPPTEFMPPVGRSEPQSSDVSTGRVSVSFSAELDSLLADFALGDVVSSL